MATGFRFTMERAPFLSFLLRGRRKHMERDPKFTLLACLLLAVAGCGESASSGAGGSAGSGGAAGSPALDPLSVTPRYAVLSSDFSSSSIAMLDADFVPIDESWISSGTTYPGLVATLSGDVVLPNRQAGDGTVAVIDRFFTDVVTRFFVPSGNLNGQLRTQGDIGDSGFSSNPQDLIFVDSDSAWVPRYESNLNPDAIPENQGNDLLEVNPSDMSATGDRIDLSSLDTTATRGERERGRRSGCLRSTEPRSPRWLDNRWSGSIASAPTSMPLDQEWSRSSI